MAGSLRMALVSSQLSSLSMAGLCLVRVLDLVSALQDRWWVSRRRYIQGILSSFGVAFDCRGNGSLLAVRLEVCFSLKLGFCFPLVISGGWRGVF